jgi:5-oxopent-3-ene-1,2,5-tricarboxylate decarboxylase/2-hydroxyhepta-2,4-diene-1,7-dioate isomerase
VADLCLPHESLYRPSLPQRARDGFFAFGPAVAALDRPDDWPLAVAVDGVAVQHTSTGERVRGVAQLIADVSEFMTLNPGDWLLLGTAPGAPRLRAGQGATVTAPGFAPLALRFVAEAA